MTPLVKIYLPRIDERLLLTYSNNHGGSYRYTSWAFDQCQAILGFHPLDSLSIDEFYDMHDVLAMLDGR